MFEKGQDYSSIWISRWFLFLKLSLKEKKRRKLATLPASLRFLFVFWFLKRPRVSAGLARCTSDFFFFLFSDSNYWWERFGGSRFSAAQQRAKIKTKICPTQKQKTKVIHKSVEITASSGFWNLESGLFFRDVVGPTFLGLGPGRAFAFAARSDSGWPEFPLGPN